MDLCSQDLRCDLTVELFLNICLVLASYVSPLRVFGESVFAMIPDHEVRAATLRNKWMSGCWWGRDASSGEHLVGAKFGSLKCKSVRRKPPGEQCSRRETLDARGTQMNLDVEMDAGKSETT